MATRIVLFLLVVVSGLVLAHFYRFTPMPGGEPLSFTPMWDRWFQRVCVVSFAGDNQVSCSMEGFTGQFSRSNEATPSPMSKVEQLRRAGFSEREVLEWVENELKAKRQQGMSDTTLAVYLFGDVPLNAQSAK
jgi:hypothetical protein